MSGFRASSIFRIKDSKGNLIDIFQTNTVGVNGNCLPGASSRVTDWDAKLDPDVVKFMDSIEFEARRGDPVDLEPALKEAKRNLKTLKDAISKK